MLPIGVSVLALVTGLTKDTPPKEASDDGSAADDGQAAGSSGADDAPSSAPSKLLQTNFGTALMLGIAYAASVGSLATIIGTPPNTLLVGYLKDNFDISIGFGQWMMAGLPLAAVFLFITWFLLTHVLFKPEIDQIPGGRALIRSELAKLGPLSKGEIRVGIMFALAALAWVSVPLIWAKPPITDAGIAMTVGVLLFVLPGGAARGVRLLDWKSALELPWGVLLLFGGGLALSAQFSSSGLTKWIGTQTEALGNVPVWLMVVVVTTGVIFLTELTSNTATAATFLPVAGGVAMGIGADPMLLAIPVALAATCAFMLPVATPPNAVAYGSGYVTIASMIKGGFWLNLIGIVLVTATTFTLMTWALGIRV
ncbi:MAG: DASS family sodium-coupled anion symporter, partial [Brevibacterium aurantiacum]|nr:DASS family sodium-coupled anion symporter [Brevibacterium aurantiacum]